MLQRYKKKIRYTNCVHKVVFLGGGGMDVVCFILRISFVYLSYIFRISFVYPSCILRNRKACFVGKDGVCCGMNGCL